MGLVDQKAASPLGSGQYFPNGSINDVELLGQLVRYRRSISSAFSSVPPDQIQSTFSKGPFHVTAKVDGELWFLVLDNGEAFLASSKGACICGDIPLLSEAQQAAKHRTGRAVLAGELYALNKDGGDRPRVSGLSSAMAGEQSAATELLRFMAFDPIQLPRTSSAAIPETPEQKSTAMAEVLGSGEFLTVAAHELAKSGDEVRALFEAWVESGQAEGLVVRSPSGRVHKVKPEALIDAVVVGYTERQGTVLEVRSVCLALMCEDGAFQLIGSCGNVGNSQQRAELHKSLASLETSTDFRKASSDGAVYRFVKPEVILEIKVDDVQAIDAAGDPIRQMMLEYREGGWARRSLSPGASLLHSAAVRVRSDKSVSPEELSFTQIADRCLVATPQHNLLVDTAPSSEIIRREVYAKTVKGETAVRKLVVWKTNKHQLSNEFPAYVVHWTDFSAGRKDRLKRTVIPAPNEEIADTEAATLIEQNIKAGWDKIAG